MDDIKVGDTVKIRYPPNMRDIMGRILIVKKVMSSQSPYWMLQGTEVEGLFMVQNDNIIFEVNPA